MCEIKCIICNNKHYKINTTKYPKNFCSYTCYEEHLKFNREPNTKCCYCNRPIYIKKSRLKKLKNGPTCSKECGRKFRSKWFSKEGNHQYNVIGDKNSSFKNKDLLTNYGYILEYCPGHPRPHDKSVKGTRVKQHRLVIEKHHYLFDEKFFEKINGWIVLKKEYEVHHINSVKTDNRLQNLKIVTKSEHRSIHNKEQEIIRDSLGRIIGVFKPCELLENPEVDNQQLS